MTGHILLEGGAEFGGRMAAPDKRAMDLAGGAEALVGIIPAAAAPDGNDRRAGENGQRWFRGIGARHVTVVALTDRASANDERVADGLRQCRLIYMLGGFPHHLGQSLAGSRSWEAMLSVYQAGAVIGGSSAGAMVLCEHYFNPETKTVEPGLNLVPGACVIPHHSSLGRRWIAQLAAALPQACLVGIDEQTGMLSEGAPGEWKVYGKGQVTLYRPDGAGATVVSQYRAGQTLSFP
jgi:cyanophycinase